VRYHQRSLHAAGLGGHFRIHFKIFVSGSGSMIDVLVGFAAFAMVLGPAFLATFYCSKSPSVKP
jgi:hypothetical protein